MKKIFNIVICIVLFAYVFLVPLSSVKAEDGVMGYIVPSGDVLQAVRTTSDFNSNTNKIRDLPLYLSVKVYERDGDGYRIKYDGDKYGYVYYTSIRFSSNFSLPDPDYGRPWTTPGKAITGGAKFIADSYISSGQNTIYFKKFNVKNAEYNHQYQTNIRAPWSEGRTSSGAYTEEEKKNLALKFIIPYYDDMTSTSLGEMSNEGQQSSVVGDSNFESQISSFPDSYKPYLRYLHQKYPKWQFVPSKAQDNFTTAVNKEVSMSCDSTGFGHTTGSCGNESDDWGSANRDAVAYFMDSRNFLDEYSIFMFEDLSESSYVSETMVQRVLNGSFMSGASSKDNKNYATIFMNAGKIANVNPIYLASLAIQESGRDVKMTTSGQSFEYIGAVYEGIYNFFNIGAYGSYSNPAKGGLLWASAGSPSVVKLLNQYYDGTGDWNLEDNSSGNSSSNTTPTPTTNFDNLVKNAGLVLKSNLVRNVRYETSVSTLKNKFSGVGVTITPASGNNNSDTALVGTGNILKLSDGANSYQKTIVVAGDVNGDGKINSGDMAAIIRHIKGLATLSGCYYEAANVATSDGRINSGDMAAVIRHIKNIEKIS